MGKLQILGIVRHVLTVVAGGLVAKGATDEATAEAAVGGIIAIATIVWSVLEKRSRI